MTLDESLTFMSRMEASRIITLLRFAPDVRTLLLVPVLKIDMFLQQPVHITRVQARIMKGHTVCCFY